MYYFAYGSNMNPKRLALRVDYENVPQKAVLKGFRLAFNKIDYSTVGAGFANIVKANGSIVEGVLYQVRPEFMKVLDCYEGVPNHYRRVKLPVETKSGSIDAAVYVATKAATGNKLRPRSSYWYHIAIGARLYLSDDYYSKILGVKCI